MTDLIPRITEPISAYDLLTKVCEVITEEPKRYNQEYWKLRGDMIARFDLPMPACATVCCVAGWIDTLRGDSEDFMSGESASRALGLQPDQNHELFDEEALERFVETPDDLPARGTAKYAALGVRHIQVFQAKYADQLKATVVKPVAQVPR